MDSLSVGLMPVSSLSRANLKLSCTHTNPFIVVLETTAVENTESGDRDCPRPHCQDKSPQTPHEEGVLRTSWARASVQR